MVRLKNQLERDNWWHSKCQFNTNPISKVIIDKYLSLCGSSQGTIFDSLVHICAALSLIADQCPDTFLRSSNYHEMGTIGVSKT